eukprot:6295764-Lingulodinium_polyedra.AAC.1
MPRLAKVHADRSAVLEMARKWDAVGTLRLFKVVDINYDEACGAFRVGKDEQWDSLILNPTVINSRCRSISRSTK